MGHGPRAEKFILCFGCHDLVQKYGQGEVSIQKCETCNYEKIIHSSGVYHDEGGCVKLYSKDDEFSCPNCDEDEPKGK